MLAHPPSTAKHAVIAACGQPATLVGVAEAAHAAEHTADFGEILAARFTRDVFAGMHIEPGDA